MTVVVVEDVLDFVLLVTCEVSGSRIIENRIVEGKLVKLIAVNLQ